MYQFLVEMVKVDGATTVRHLLSQGDESNVAEDRDIVGLAPCLPWQPNLGMQGAFPQTQPLASVSWPTARTASFPKDTSAEGWEI